jgi:hypothetical protein
VIRIEASPSTTDNIAKVLLSLLANRAQADFRNRLVIASLSSVRWIRTADD